MKAKGFTLTEILLVAAILGIIAGGLFTIVLAAQRTWEKGYSQVFLNAQLRTALERMTRQLAQSPVDQVARPLADGNWDTTAIFRIPQDQNADGQVLDSSGNILEWSVWLRYLLGANNLLQCKLNTAPEVTYQTLAGGISDLEFRRQPATPDVMEMMATATTQQAGNVVSRTMTSRVKLRNLQSGSGVPDEDPPDDF